MEVEIGEKAVAAGKQAGRAFSIPYPIGSVPYVAHHDDGLTLNHRIRRVDRLNLIRYKDIIWQLTIFDCLWHG